MEYSKRRPMETADMTAAQLSFLRCLKEKDIREYRRLQIRHILGGGRYPWDLTRSPVPETAVNCTSPVSPDAAKRSLLRAQIRNMLEV